MTLATSDKTFLTVAITAIAISISHSALAETVVVKQRGAVDLKPF